MQITAVLPSRDVGASMSWSFESNHVKIESFEVYRIAVDARTRWVMLALSTSDGHSGLGECLLPDDSDLGVHALTEVAATLVGRDVERVATPVSNLSMEHSSGLLEATVRSAVDQCLWDLRARALDVPLYRLLGPTLRGELRLYANINRGTSDRSPEGFAVRATRAVEAGFGAVKIAPFDGVTRANIHTAAGRAAFALGIARTLAVRAAIGDETMLMIDCHCRLDLSSARRFLVATDAARIDWFEDVLPYHDIDGWQHLKGASSVPLVGGETARGIRDLMPFVQRGLWDVLMPDVRFFGGVTELVALAGFAMQHQLTLAPHNPRGPVGTLASAHAMIGCPVFYMLEYQFEECSWREQLVGGAESVQHGRLRVSDAAGLGCRLDPALLARHAVADDAS